MSKRAQFHVAIHIKARPCDSSALALGRERKRERERERVAANFCDADAALLAKLLRRNWLLRQR